MENKDKLHAEMVKIQSKLFDIGHDIKRTQRSLKYCPAPDKPKQEDRLRALKKQEEEYQEQLDKILDFVAEHILVHDDD